MRGTHITCPREGARVPILDLNPDELWRTHKQQHRHQRYQQHQHQQIEGALLTLLPLPLPLQARSVRSKPDQARPYQTIPDQTIPDHTRPNHTEHGSLLPELFQEPDEVRHDVLVLGDAVRAPVHEDGRPRVHPGKPLGLRGGHEPVFDGPHVQARQLFLGLLLCQRVARDLGDAVSVGGVGGEFGRRIVPDSCLRPKLVGHDASSSPP